MVYCFDAELYWSNATRRDEVRAEIEAAVAEQEQWGLTLVQNITHEFTGLPGLLVEARFTTSAAAQSVRTRAENRVTGSRVPAAGSSLEVHDCTHDGTGGSCVVVYARTW